MSNNQNFESVIKAELDRRAANDEQFAKTYAKDNKSIQECCKWILQEVSKMERDGNCIAIPDEEVYGMAVHYYDEDECRVEEAPAYSKPKPIVAEPTLFDFAEKEDPEDDTEE